MAHYHIRDFEFVHGINRYVPDWVFLRLQTQVMPIAGHDGDVIEVADVDPAQVHTSVDFTIVVFGAQALSSPWDFAQRVLYNPADSPHVTAVHEVTSLWFSVQGWVWTSTRIFNTLLEEWVPAPNGTHSTIAWYQIGAVAPPAMDAPEFPLFPPADAVEEADMVDGDHVEGMEEDVGEGFLGGFEDFPWVVGVVPMDEGYTTE